MAWFTDMNLSAIDLNLLHVLHVVLEEKSVARAAARLHVTSPAVSNALARLRERLGDPLLVRSGRGLVPTPRALELAPLLTRALADLELAIEGPRFDPQTATNELTLALTDADQLASLPAIAHAFAESLPRARLRVVSIDTLVASGGLAGSEVDVALGPGGPGDGLHLAPIYEEEGVLVVRRDHPRVRRRLSRERFLAERHVDIHLALGQGGVGHRVAEDAFAKHGLSRDIALTVPSFATAAMVVASTDWITGMPRRLAEMLRRTIAIEIVDSPLPGFRFTMQMMWHERTHLDPAAAHLRELIAGVFAHPQSRDRVATSTSSISRSSSTST